MQTSFLIFFLASVRVVAMLIVSPVFSLRQIPAFVKVGLSLIIGVLISSTLDTANIVLPSTAFGLYLAVGKEVLMGLSIGYISTLVFNAIRVSAQFMDFSIGFSMSQYYDPSTAGNSTPLERFFNWLALIIFLTFNFHHIILSAVIKSFEVVPIGILQFNAEIFPVILNIFSSSFYLAVQLAAPIVIVLFITDFTMGLIARTVPQINVFILGMPVKVLVGLAAIAAILPGLIHMNVKSLEKMSGDLIKFFNMFPFIALMASDDKTEEPTHKKLQDARKKGQVAKSVDLNSAIILLGITLALSIVGNFFYNSGRLFIIESFNYITKDDLSVGEITGLFIYMMKNGLIASMPIVLTAMVLGVVGNIAQTGFMSSGEGLKPKLEKLNPLEGFKKFFSKRTFVELAKSILKVVLISYVAFSFVEGKIVEILKTSDLNPRGIFPFVKSITDAQLVRLILVMLAIGLADYIFQKRQFKQDLKMSKQEVKEEYKQQEGDPQIKSRIKQKQRELAMKRMMHEVPKATVVVTNPTHFAVALKYERGMNSAPKVVAKGADNVAQKIKQIAKENDVPIIENKPLARALYAKVELDSEVPVDLYQAVAEIIAYIYSFKKN
jgi:flagellar biosynthesis protein FliR/FlhB